MILYFSGTGNSSYVGRSLGNILGEAQVFMPDVDCKRLVFEGQRLIMVFPVYSWGVPPYVMDFIRGLSVEFVNKLKDNRIPVVMVCTCGDETANTPEMFASVWNKRGVAVAGSWSVIMPNNYVLLPGFSTDPHDVEERKLCESSSRIREIAEKIKKENWETNVVRGSWPVFKTRVIYPLFRRWGIDSRRWKVSDKCVSCGRCATICPMQNIKLTSGKPRWSDLCASCTGCYHMCPSHAVSYGHITDGKRQYFCRLKPLEN